MYAAVPRFLRDSVIISSGTRIKIRSTDNQECPPDVRPRSKNDERGLQRFRSIYRSESIDRKMALLINAAPEWDTCQSLFGNVRRSIEGRQLLRSMDPSELDRLLAGLHEALAVLIPDNAIDRLDLILDVGRAKEHPAVRQVWHTAQDIVETKRKHAMTIEAFADQLVLLLSHNLAATDPSILEDEVVPAMHSSSLLALQPALADEALPQAAAHLDQPVVVATAPGPSTSPQTHAQQPPPMMPIECAEFREHAAVCLSRSRSASSLSTSSSVETPSASSLSADTNSDADSISHSPARISRTVSTYLPAPPPLAIVQDVFPSSPTPSLASTGVSAGPPVTRVAQGYVLPANFARPAPHVKAVSFDELLEHKLVAKKGPRPRHEVMALANAIAFERLRGGHKSVRALARGYGCTAGGAQSRAVHYATLIHQLLVTEGGGRLMPPAVTPLPVVTSGAPSWSSTVPPSPLGSPPSTPASIELSAASWRQRASQLIRALFVRREIDGRRLEGDWKEVGWRSEGDWKEIGAVPPPVQPQQQQQHEEESHRSSSREGQSHTRLFELRPPLKTFGIGLGILSLLICWRLCTATDWLRRAAELRLDRGRSGGWVAEEGGVVVSNRSDSSWVTAEAAGGVFHRSGESRCPVGWTAGTKTGTKDGTMGCFYVPPQLGTHRECAIEHCPRASAGPDGTLGRHASLATHLGPSAESSAQLLTSLRLHDQNLCAWPPVSIASSIARSLLACWLCCYLFPSSSPASRRVDSLSLSLPLLSPLSFRDRPLPRRACTKRDGGGE